MNEILEKLCEIAEKANPDFDRNDDRDLDVLTKSYILSMEDDTLKQRYLEQCIAKGEELSIKKKIEETGPKAAEYEIRILELEKEILEKRIETARKFLN